MSDYLQDRILGLKKRIADDGEKRRKDAEEKIRQDAETKTKAQQRLVDLDRKWAEVVSFTTDAIKKINDAKIEYIETIVFQQGSPQETIFSIGFKTIDGHNSGMNVQRHADGTIASRPAGRTRKIWNPNPIDLLTVSREDMERMLMDFVDLIDPSR